MHSKMWSNISNAFDTQATPMSALSSFKLDIYISMTNIQGNENVSWPGLKPDYR